MFKNNHIARAFFASRLPVVFCLLIFFALALRTARIKSPTVDESAHFARAVALWQTDDLRLQAQQPPLSHWLIGLLVQSEPGLPDITRMESWATAGRIAIARELLWQSGLDVARVILLARLPIIFLGLLVGAMMARWAWEREGAFGQLVAALLFAFSPNLLAFSSLATTDLVTAAVYLATIFALWKYWQRPSTVRWLLVSVCLGMALAAKLTALLLLPIALLLYYIPRWPPRPWWRPGLVWLLGLPVAAFTLWGLYGFELRPVQGIPFPLPAATYIDNFLHAQDHIDSGHGSYLFGELSTDGWWYYFIVAFLMKTPLPTLLLLLPAALFFARCPRWRREAFLGVPAVALFAAASYARLNIGYRHILPVLPFVLVGAATGASYLRHIYSGRLPLPFSRHVYLLPHLASLLLLLWYVLGNLWQYPHYLAYFNEAVGGSDQGYRYLSDSNIDWGQDLKLLAAYGQQTEEPLKLSYFGSADPAYYGLTQPPLADGRGNNFTFSPANPEPGRYAISVTHLQGVVFDDASLFDWFRHRQPVDRVGYSIFIYDVPRQVDGAWVAYCLDPGPLVEPATAARLVGQQGLRNVYFDCRSSWVFPAEGAPGWYILPQQAETWWLQETFTQAFTAVYQHSASASAPSYSVYYWQGTDGLVQKMVTDSPDARLGEAQPVALPLPVAETVDLLGYDVGVEEWTTVWQVQAPASQPLSILGHLYHGEPTPVVADGLGYSSEQWQPGDIFVQSHPFANAGDGRFLETGVYNYLNGEQLPLGDDGRVGETVRLYRPPGG